MRVDLARGADRRVFDVRVGRQRGLRADQRGPVDLCGPARVKGSARVQTENGKSASPGERDALFGDVHASTSKFVFDLGQDA